jgi:hypothetical protein
MNFIDKILNEAFTTVLLYEAKGLKLLFQRVKSSNLHSIAYDKKTKTLQIKFKGGGLYQYNQVPEKIFRAILRAKSKGKYFWRNVRDEYEYKRLNT